MIAPDKKELLNQLMHFYLRFKQCMQSQLQLHQTHLMHLQKRLQHPGEKLQQQSQQVDHFEKKLLQLMRLTLNTQHQKIAQYAQLLETLSPLKILQRGFSITRDKSTHKIMSSCKEITAGKIVVTQLSDGEFESEVVG